MSKHEEQYENAEEAQQEKAELSEDELEDVAGGGCIPTTSVLDQDGDGDFDAEDLKSTGPFSGPGY